MTFISGKIKHLLHGKTCYFLSETILKLNSAESMEFYREGFLNKAGKGIQKHMHSWRPRYFVLDGWQLKYYKSKEILPDNMLGSIDVPEIESVSVMKNEKKAFQITTNAPTRRTYYMSGRTEDEIKGWIKCLQMAKAKYLEKQKKSSSEVPVHSIYNEFNFAPVNPSPPTKPTRSLIVSGSGFLEPSQSPTSPDTPGSPTSKTTPSVKPVLSAYQSFHFPSTVDEENPEQSKDKDEILDADPTYDKIDEKAASKTSENSEPAADLYDTVNTSTTKTSPAKKMNRASDPFPQAAAPPPLPARLPSMSAELNETEEENKEPEAEDENQRKPSVCLSEDVASPDTAVSENPQPEEKVFGVYDEFESSISNSARTDLGGQKLQPSGDASLYDEVRNADAADTKDSGSENTKAQAGNAFDLYDEVATPNLAPATDSGSEISQPQGDGFALYDEVGNQDGLTSGVTKQEVKSALLLPDPTHVYAKPQKSSSMKRGPSKRRLMPGLMDVGEVDIDIEEDAAGGKETLQRGMTKPQGDRFAIEELREVLAEFDKEGNNNEHGEMLPDFDVNQNESSFEVLRMFLEKYE